VIDLTDDEFPAYGEGDVDERTWEVDGTVFKTYFRRFTTAVELMKFVERYGPEAILSYAPYGDSCPLKAPHIILNFAGKSRRAL